MKDDVASARMAPERRMLDLVPLGRRVAEDVVIDRKDQNGVQVS